MMQRVEKDIEFMVRDNKCVWQITRTASKFTSPTCHELIAPEETIDHATKTGTEICIRKGREEGPLHCRMETH